MWACPKCQSTDLTVNVSIWAALTQDEDGNFETSVDGDVRNPFNNPDHEWNEHSGMQCIACGHHDNADKFEVPEAYSCPKCGDGHSSTDHVDEGEGDEAGRTFYYCSEHCLETH